MSNTAARTIPYAVRATLGALGLGLAGLAITAAASHSRAVAATPDVTAIAFASTENTSSKSALTAHENVAPEGKPDVQLVIRAAGANYMVLATVPRPAWDEDVETEQADGETEVSDTTYAVREAELGPSIAMPVHGPEKLHDATEGVASVIASVKPADVPESYRLWLGKQVEIAGHCTTTVTGFAVVTRTTGWPDWSSEDGSETKWTKDAVLENGATVLAATFADNQCKGDFARDAELTHASTLAKEKATTLPDATTVIADARKLLVDSAAGSQTQIEWKDQENMDRWDTAESTTWDETLYIHPKTQQMFLAVHASNEQGCGGPDVRMLGIFKVDIDGRHTTLTPVTMRAMGDLEGVNDLVDLDSDGTPEVVGPGTLGTDMVIQTASGGVITISDMPFVGCPC